MNILILHNKYLIPGGEDYCFENDVELLKSRGHSVFEIVLDNKEILKLGKLRTALRTIWSVDSYKIVKNFLKSTPCQFIIAHNLFPLFSPSVYHAAYLLKTPIIQVLHNYRISCINGLFLRNNHICEDCVGKFFPWPGVIHKCYRNSFLGSLSVVMMLFVHRLLKTWNEKVNGYIALTDFAKNEYIQSGLPSTKIFIKPNYLYADPGKGEYKEKHFIYAGRLSKEKGINTLIDSLRSVDGDFQLTILGGGPLEKLVNNTGNDSIKYVGFKPNAEAIELIKKSYCLILPSIFYEGMPRTILEAFATGTPVIASNIGGIAEIVDNGRTGLLFYPGNAKDLAEKINWALRNPSRMAEMGNNARIEFELKYSFDVAYDNLINIYEIIRKQPSGNKISKILGMPISAITMADALTAFQGWIERFEPNYVCCVPAHSVMECYDHPELRKVYAESGLNTPDGMAIVWLLHWAGHKNVERVYGPDLLLRACEYGLTHGWRHYFYGGTQTAVDALEISLAKRFPSLKVAGAESPPFRPLTTYEEKEAAARIRAAAPDIVWVGLGSPKQEQWMYDHVESLGVPVLVGVGAAFDFLSGIKPQAPRWVQRAGLEWFYRLVSEPRRLWKRYLFGYPRFVWLVIMQRFGLLRLVKDSSSRSE